MQNMEAICVFQAGRRSIVPDSAMKRKENLTVDRKL